MKVTSIYMCILLWISMLYIAGMYLFTKGFLLTRVEIAEKSGRQSSTLARTRRVQSDRDSARGKRSVTPSVSFKRAVVLVIDALRYDFAAFNASLDGADAMPFQNKLPVIHETISKHPDRAVLFKSLADPPTTTLQRLKGIITGSLPTFVDAGHNFASFEISEDNIVDQLFHAGKRVVFMGDDTWMTLFKNKFHRAFPFPSFNVKDLHTVDEGIMAHLIPEMRRDWDVIIAHFLGVDHCGHSLGPYHESMGEKLTQMNSVIQSVIRTVDEDTILFVLGDHGMTRTGDHGGDSPEELATALFVYSPSKLFDQVNKEMLPETVSQIDFVPTFSLLLGIPIPFSNLGSIIPPFFSLSHQSALEPESQLPKPLAKLEIIRRRLTAYHSNAQQINAYVAAYNEKASDFPMEEYSSLIKSYKKAEREMEYVNGLLPDETMSEVIEASLLALEESYRKYILGIRAMCHSVWAKFEIPHIYQGVALILLAIVLGCLVVTVQHYTDAERMDSFLQSAVKKVFGWTLCTSVSGYLLETTFISQATSAVFIPSMLSICVFVCDLFIEVSKIDFSKLTRSITLSSAGRFILVLSPALFHSAFLTSDSHVINEGKAIIFFVQSGIMLFTISYTLCQYGSTSVDRPKPWTRFKMRRLMSSLPVRTICLGLAMMACVRLSGLFVSCREEQYWCAQSMFTQPLSLLSSEHAGLRSYRYFLSIACIAALPAALIYLLNSGGNLSGNAGQVYSVRYGLPLASVCICMYWGLQALPEGMQDRSASWQQVLFPQIAYAMIGAAAALQWGWPLNLLLVKRTANPKSSSRQSQENVVAEPPSSNGKSIKAGTNRSRPEQSDTAHHEDADVTEELPPLVYGLSSVFSATYAHAAISMSLLIALLHSDGLAPAVLLMVVEAFIYLEIYAATRRKQLTPFIAMPSLHRIGFFSVPWFAVAGWSLMASQFFFATGHQATFTAIQFESAYVGFNGDFPRYLYVIPATLISFNTFGSQIFFAAMLPLLVIWPFTRGLWATRQMLASEEEHQGELNLHTYAADTARALFQTSLMFLAFQACDLLGTMVAAAILRRHLMAWSVFAPRFIFQGVAFGAVILTVLITHIFFANIQHRLGRWIARIRS